MVDRLRGNRSQILALLAFTSVLMVSCKAQSERKNRTVSPERESARTEIVSGNSMNGHLTDRSVASSLENPSIETSGNSSQQNMPAEISNPLSRTNGTTDVNGPKVFIKNMGEDYRMGVVSLNLDGRNCSMNARGESCPQGAKHFKDALMEYRQEYSLPWDIVGVQELDTKKDLNNPDAWHTETAQFREILSSVFGKSYNCVEQQEYSNDFYAAICSHYPIVEGSYMEFVVYHWESGVNRQNRVMQCVQLSAPAGIITSCNTHTRAGSDEPRQFFEGFNFIEGTYLPSRIPSNVHSDSKGDYINALRASLVITGDMNTNVRNITGNGRMKSACDCDIDQVMTVDMEHYYQASAPPFLEDYLIIKERGSRKYAGFGWPTDHQSPSIQPIAINKDLIVNIKYEGQQENGEVAPPPAENQKPNLVIGPGGELLKAQVWIANNTPSRIDFYIPGHRLCGDTASNQILFDRLEVFSATSTAKLGWINAFVKQDPICWQGTWGSKPGDIDVDGTVLRIFGTVHFFREVFNDVIYFRIQNLTTFTPSIDFRQNASN